MMAPAITRPIHCTLRKVSDGIGVERIFPIHSPNISKIVIARHGAVKRAKLFYLRDKTGKAAKIRERKAPTETASS